MGLISAIRSRFGRKKTSETTSSFPSLFYSLPFQRGRELHNLQSTTDPNRHNAGWVYAAVRAISQGCAGSAIKFFERGQNGARTILKPSHPLTRLFREVNPHHTYSELIESTVLDLELSGNAYWLLTRKPLSNAPAEIWPISPQWIKIIPGDEKSGGLIAGYVLKRGGKKIRLDAQDVLHFRYASTQDSFYGYSPLSAASFAVETDEAISNSQRRSFDNDAMPGLIMKSNRELTREQRKRLRTEFEANYTGRDAAGRMIITGPEAEITPFTQSPREMAFRDSARLVRDRILGSFGVPPAVLGLVEDFNRANAEAANILFARRTLLPKLRLLASRITQNLCSQFLPYDIEAEFTSPVPEDRDTLRKDIEMGVKLGLLTPNEARAEFFNRSPIENSNKNKTTNNKE